MHKTNIPESWTINQWIGQDSFTRLPAYGYRQGRARIPRTKIVCKAQVLLKTPTHLLKTPTLKRNAIRRMIMLKPRQIRLDISLKSETPGAFHDRLTLCSVMSFFHAFRRILPYRPFGEPETRNSSGDSAQEREILEACLDRVSQDGGHHGGAQLGWISPIWMESFGYMSCEVISFIIK